jgi:hypothetical protein
MAVNEEEEGKDPEVSFLTTLILTKCISALFQSRNLIWNKKPRG